MTDVAILMFLLLVYLLVGIVVNVVVMSIALQDLRSVVDSGLNGSRRVIAIGAVRRKLLRLLVQLGLLLLYLTRIVRGQPASQVVAFTVGLLIVTCVNLDAIADFFDRRMLKWFLHDVRGHDKH